MKVNSVIKKMSCLALLIWVSSQAVRAEEAPVTPEKLDQLVKDLGNEDFAKRQKAEADLLKAGVKAQAALTKAAASTDAQVKATATKLLGKLKLNALGAVDYLEVLPGKTIIALQAKNIATTIESSKKTALGQMVLSQVLEGFRTQLQTAMDKQPDVKKQVMLWHERFKGQVAAGIWEMNLAQPDKMRMAVVAEVTDPEPQAVFDDFMKQTGMVEQVKAEMYKDVEIQQSVVGGGAVALAGKHFLFSNNGEAMRELIDGLMSPNGLGKSPKYLQIKPALGAKPDLIVTMDFKAYMKAVMAIAPMPGFEDLMKSAGANADLIAMSSSTIGDTFEDRWIMSMDGPPTGMASIGIPPADAPAPLNDLAAVPTNSVLASVGYMDGGKAQVEIVKYLDSLKKMMDGMKAQMPPGAEPMPDFPAIIKTFEEKAGLKVADILGNIKGSNGFYVVLAPTPALVAPDIGLFITCVDAEKAKVVSAAMAKALNAYGPGAVKELPVANRTIFQLDLAPLGVPVPPNFPYLISWSVEGNRIFVGSSVQALRKQLSYIENKTPGLLTQPDFIKALGALSPEERKGGMFYVDMKTVLIEGGKVALPLLNAQIPDEQVKKTLAAVPPPQQMFKDVPPMLITSVFTGNQQQTIMRAPLPPLPTIFVLSVGAGMMQFMQTRAVRGIDDAPPGGF
jgi:hypothetical protein